MRHVQWMVFVLLLPSSVGYRPVHDAADKVPGWELKPAAPNAVPVAATEKMPGIYPAGSRIADQKALGGFGPCDNYPKDLAGKDWGERGTISVVAFPDEPVAYFKHRGIALRLVNRTEQVASFAACDSCLFLVREALDGAGQWQEIESPPEAICGNGFHRVSCGKPLGPLGRESAWPVRASSHPFTTRAGYTNRPRLATATKAGRRMEPGG